MKKSFTLIELLIVITLISAMYAIFLPNLKTLKINNEIINLKNIKFYLKDNFKFEKSLKLTCLEKICYIYIDGEKLKDFEIKGLFQKVPTVFQNDEDIDFNEIKIDNFSKKVIFEIEFNKDYKTKDLILEFENILYYYNSIKMQALVFESFDEYENYKEDLKLEVMNAF